jgi:hypothetical protein
MIMGKLFLSENETKTKFLAKKIFDLYPEIKSEYAKSIRSILKDVYPENWVKGKDWWDTGVYNLEKKGRSVINKFDTNYSVLGILIDSVNEYVAKSGFDESIDIDINDEVSVRTNMEKLINFLNEYKHRIFGKDSKLFKKLFDTVSQTHGLGEKNEDFAIEKLKKIFGNENDY